MTIKMKNSACIKCEVDNKTDSSDLTNLSKNSSSFETKSVVDMGVSFTEWVTLAAIVAVRAGAVVNTSVEVLSGVVVFNAEVTDTLNPNPFKMSLNGSSAALDSNSPRAALYCALCCLQTWIPSNHVWPIFLLLLFPALPQFLYQDPPRPQQLFLRDFLTEPHTEHAEMAAVVVCAGLFLQAAVPSVHLY